MSGGVVSGRECHEEVTDEDGHAEPCNKPAVGWRIEPEENTPYPVCSLHHRWPYADEWVAAQERIARVEAVCEEATERAYWDISREKMLTVQTNGPGRAKVPGHWRESAEFAAFVSVTDIRKALAPQDPA